ncbi:GRIP and coiled-coil domain containing 88 kDa [Arctopsyche grandis]|uniref:GRIP and coiled-coil domain containing 88 kDa n=1 Tax=Arctopsyche grandis TaxID=121162 RepID=UPI00406D6DDD
MEKMSRATLVDTISKQKEQLQRYEYRLRDVVTAYKGLMREKEALESSLAAINNTEKGLAQDASVAKLTLSVSTLVAEKARMEEAYQNDKRLAREENDKILKELQDQLHNLSKQRQSELENIKAKLAFEIQEREKEHVEHTLMLKEFQTKLSAERRSKEKLEDKFVISNDPGSRELEKRFRDLNSELEATQRKLNRAEARTIETPQMLVQLQDEISQMKQNHIVALREERIKAKKAEETARNMCASQEERVAALEARLAELSNTVGEYDIQRRKDQEIIQHLRDNVETKLHKDKSHADRKTSLTEDDDLVLNSQSSNMVCLQKIIDKIHSLKKELIIVNEKMGSPIDVWNIFNANGSGVSNIHFGCKSELAALKAECDVYKRKLSHKNSLDIDSTPEPKKASENELYQLKSHIKTLQDKVEVLNQQIEEIEKECEAKIKIEHEKFNTERLSYKEEVLEHKNRVQTLEQQLKVQRDRYAVLLAEREGEIKARQVESDKSDTNHKHDFNGSLQEISAPPHMLHYAHELARKDLEISGLRKEKHIMEGQLRDSQRDATIEKDRFKEVRRNLKEEIDRLRRIQSREGANLEYLKNVVLSYLLSTNSYSKRHMFNAIAAVLHFTDNEKETVHKIIF